MADRLLWMLVPRRNRPKEWPVGEPALAARWGISIWGMRLWMRQLQFREVAAKIGPFWSEEDIVSELNERLIERALVDLDTPGKDGNPKHTELALKTLGKLQAGGGRPVTVNVQQVNAPGQVTDPSEMLSRAKRLVEYAEARQRREIEAHAVEVTVALPHPHEAEVVPDE